MAHRNRSVKSGMRRRGRHREIECLFLLFSPLNLTLLYSFLFINLSVSFFMSATLSILHAITVILILIKYTKAMYQKRHPLFTCDSALKQSVGAVLNIGRSGLATGER